MVVGRVFPIWFHEPTDGMKIIINHISTVDGPTLFPVVVDGNQYNAKLDRFYSASSSTCPIAHTLLLLLEFCRMSCEEEED